MAQNECGKVMEDMPMDLDLDQQIALMKSVGTNTLPPPPFVPDPPPEKKILGLDGQWRTLSQIREIEQRKYNEAMKAAMSGPPRYTPADPPEDEVPWLEREREDGRTNREAWLDRQSLLNRLFN